MTHGPSALLQERELVRGAKTKGGHCPRVCRALPSEGLGSSSPPLLPPASLTSPVSFMKCVCPLRGVGGPLCPLPSPLDSLLLFSVLLGPSPGQPLSCPGSFLGHVLLLRVSARLCLHLPAVSPRPETHKPPSTGLVHQLHSRNLVHQATCQLWV